MALIVCTECGKKFSDKAACCPECGCPTEEVLKNTNTEEIVAKRNQTSEQASKSMLEEVEKARIEARSAENLFDSRNSEIQRKANRNIDLFGGNATSRVVEIRSDARRACDDLYTTYQSLVETVDGLCRPLLQLEPSGEAIKAVCDLIKFLNEESEIESNFTASFNGSSLGNVANSKYVPSIENKMIQKFWQSQYASSPKAIEYENQRRKKAEEERKHKEAEQKKAEAERKKIERQQEELGEQYKKHMEEVVSDCKRKEETFKSALSEELLARKKNLSDQISSHVDELNFQKDKLEKEISSLGFFNMKEKKEKRQTIELIEMKINKLTDSNISVAEEEKMKNSMVEAIELYKTQIESYLSKRFPNKDKNKKSFEKYQEAKDYMTRDYPEPPDVKTVFR